MAIVKFTNSKGGSVGGLLRYMTDEEKTKKKLISGKDCVAENAAAEFQKDMTKMDAMITRMTERTDTIAKTVTDMNDKIAQIVKQLIIAVLVSQMSLFILLKLLRIW